MTLLLEHLDTDTDSMHSTFGHLDTHLGGEPSGDDDPSTDDGDSDGSSDDGDSGSDGTSAAAITTFADAGSGLSELTLV